MGRHSPVLVQVVLLWVVFLVVREGIVELDALGEVSGGFEAVDVLREVEVAVGVDACLNHPVPVHALQLDVGVILLELKVERLSEVDVGPLDCEHVLLGHFELSKLEVLGQDFHFN